LPSKIDEINGRDAPGALELLGQNTLELNPAKSSVRFRFQPGKTVYFQPVVGLEIPVLTFNSEDFDCPAIRPTFQVNDGPGS
jgi:hypothetical protein